MTPLPYERITEGTTHLFVSKENVATNGPGSKGNAPFYNPTMELNRDLSILLAQWFVTTRKQPTRILDGLGASGARGIRFACELQGDIEVTINDWNDDAVALIQKNIEENNATDVVVTQQELSVLLSQEHFDYIDIDPFGSPIAFLDAAMKGVSSGGIVACTATDTATLCGVYPKTCLRRYAARPLYSWMMKEVGLRILLGVLCREAAKHDKGIVPLVSYTTDHYFRVYIQVRQSKKAANASIASLATIPSSTLDFSRKKDDALIGPLWMEPLHEKKVIQHLRDLLFQKEVNTKHHLWKLLFLLEEEATAPAFFYTTDHLASFFKRSPPPRDDLFAALTNRGFLVTRTHFVPTGFKTNALAPCE